MCDYLCAASCPIDRTYPQARPAQWLHRSTGLRGHTARVGRSPGAGRPVRSIRGLELSDGAERWKTDLPGDDALNLLGRIWVSGDALIVPSFGGAIFAFNRADGALRWEHGPGGADAT